MILAALSEISKKVPQICWASISLCIMMYTLTVCYVMLRSQEVNLTIEGMSVEMTRAASTQETAATELEKASAIITELRAEVSRLSENQPMPIIEQKHEYETPNMFKEKAQKLREQSQNMQRQVQQQQQQYKK